MTDPEIEKFVFVRGELGEVARGNREGNGEAMMTFNKGNRPSNDGRLCRLSSGRRVEIATKKHKSQTGVPTGDTKIKKE